VSDIGTSPRYNSANRPKGPFAKKSPKAGASAKTTGESEPADATDLKKKLLTLFAVALQQRWRYAQP